MAEGRVTGEHGPSDILRLTERFGRIGFWRVDVPNEVVYWSDEVFRIHDVDPEDGEPALADAINFYAPEVAPVVQAAVAASASTGEPFELEDARIISATGVERYVYSKGECRTDDDGNTVEIYGIFQDVTEQVLSRRNMAISKARLELVVQAGLGVWEYDVATRTILVSPELSKILGRETDTPISVSLDDFLGGIPEPDRIGVLEALAAQIDDDTPYLIEHRAIGAGGKTIWLRSRGIAERDSQGKAIRVAGSVEDITPIREATDAALEANSRFNLAVTGASVGVWEVALPSGDMYVSDRLKKIVGAPVLPSTQEGRFVWKLETFLSNIHPADQAAMRKAIDRHLKGRVPFKQEYRFKHTATQQYVHVLIRGQAEWDDKGEPIRMAGSLEDISQRVAHLEALRQSEQRFKLAAEGASVGIWDWLDVNRSEEYWSPNFYSLLGYDYRDLTPSIETFQSLLHPDDVEHTFAAVTAHFESDKPFKVEYRLRHKTEGYRWFLGTAQAAFDADGKPTRMVGSIQDIHERKTAEDKLRKANSDLDQFASVASHDLQEPLRKVAQFSALLERDYGDRLDGDGVLYLGFLMDGAQRMSRMVKDLLTYSRMGDAALNVNPVALENIMAEVIDDLSEVIRESGAEIILTPNAPDIPADPELLRRLLQNLVANGIKYNGSDTPRITVSAVQSTSAVHITVQDNGIGFDPKQADRIFEIFRRLHRREEYSGSGLGLAICKRIVEMHDGKIWAESEPGQGAVFHINLPIREPVVQASVA